MANRGALCGPLYQSVPIRIELPFLEHQTLTNSAAWLQKEKAGRVIIVSRNGIHIHVLEAELVHKQALQL